MKGHSDISTFGEFKPTVPMQVTRTAKTRCSAEKTSSLSAVVAYFTLTTLMCIIAENFAEAKLVGTDRDEFISNFIRGCYQSIESRDVIMAHGGGPNELKKYCDCASKIYADNLDIDTIRQVSERRRKKIADVSREVCLKRVFSPSR